MDKNVFAGEFLRLPAQTNAKSRTSGADKTFGRTKSVPYAGTAYDEKSILEQQIKRQNPSIFQKTKACSHPKENDRFLRGSWKQKQPIKMKKAKILVANVILNRVRSKEFPNSIESVVFQRAYGKVQVFTDSRWKI